MKNCYLMQITLTSWSAREAHSGKSVTVVDQFKTRKRAEAKITVPLGGLRHLRLERIYGQRRRMLHQKLLCRRRRKGAYIASIIEEFGKDFLKRPINLSLVCYLYKTTDVRKTGIEGHGISQTKLFNEMVKHILHVYLRTKKLQRGCEKLDAFIITKKQK